MAESGLFYSEGIATSGKQWDCKSVHPGSIPGEASIDLAEM